MFPNLKEQVDGSILKSVLFGIKNIRDTTDNISRHRNGHLKLKSPGRQHLQGC